MKCPTDGTTLTMSERSGIEIDYCPECRGVWLDRGELDKIIERSDTQPAPAAPAAPAAPIASTYEQERDERRKQQDQRYAQADPAAATARRRRRAGSARSSTELRLAPAPRRTSYVSRDGDQRRSRDVMTSQAAYDVAGSRRESASALPAATDESVARSARRTRPDTPGTRAPGAGARRRRRRRHVLWRRRRRSRSPPSRAGCRRPRRVTPYCLPPEVEVVACRRGSRRRTCCVRLGNPALAGSPRRTSSSPSDPTAAGEVDQEVARAGRRRLSRLISSARRAMLLDRGQPLLHHHGDHQRRLAVRSSPQRCPDRCSRRAWLEVRRTVRRPPDPSAGSAGCRARAAMAHAGPTRHRDPDAARRDSCVSPARDQRGSPSR